MENKESLEAKNEGKMPVGKWRINQKECTGCGECIYACRRQLLAIKDGILYIKNEQLCNECGDCSSVCAYRAISFA